MPQQKFLKYFARRLKAARKALGVSQVTAAEITGLNYRHYQRIEGGKTDLKSSTMLLLQDKLSFWETILFSGLEKEHDFTNAPDSHICLLDGKGNILYTNAAWRAFAEANGCPPERVSTGNYFDACQKAAGGGSQTAKLLLEKVHDLEDAEGFAFSYTCHSPFEARWFRAHVEKAVLYGNVTYLVVHTPIQIRPPVTESR